LRDTSAISKAYWISADIRDGFTFIDIKVFSGRYDSTGFYFNDSVEIEVEKTREGLKITRFETRILDKQGDSLKGIDGLAMLLVDVDYNGEVFDMDRTIFAKDIGENGEVKLAGLTDNVAVIAIDKHGNESKVYLI